MRLKAAFNSRGAVKTGRMARARGRVKRPWDLLLGRDVFRDSVSLDTDLVDSLLAHWAPNCGTFSRARERPIKGVRNPPKPLRSTAYPKGIPNVLVSLPKAKLSKLVNDTRMADLAAENCANRHLNSLFFSLEHPLNSIARHLPSWIHLESLPGVFATEYHACMFEGCKRRKRQILIHNAPELHDAVSRICKSESRCSRTGERHLGWKPQVSEGRVKSFSTGEEREYPKGFCESYAAGVSNLADRLGSSMTFVEIFSGPHAPLSKAVAEALEDDEYTTPDRLKDVDRYIVSEASKIEDLKLSARKSLEPGEPEVGMNFKQVRPGSSQPEEPVGRQPEVDRSRNEALQAGKQPSFGKRQQLIPDGLGDPLRHLELAKQLPHPFDAENAIKEDHLNNIKFVANSKPEAVIEYRLKALHELQQMAERCRLRQAKANSFAAWTAKKLGLRIQTELMKQLQQTHLIEDKDVPRICLEGANITGKALESPFFEEWDVPPKLEEEEFHKTKRERSLSSIDRVKRMAQAGSLELAEAIHAKTGKEVAKQTMGPPMSWEQIDDLFQGDFQVVPSFGLEQGGPGLEKKFRRIDDHTAAGNNLQAHRRQKVPMAMVDYLGALIKVVARKTGKADLRLATEDMTGAYRQVPLAPQDVRYSITGVYNPHTRRVDLHLMYGQPFGAGHAVPNFCRVAEWIARLLQRRFMLIVDHFFDDFWLVEPAKLADSAMFVLRECFSVLGFQLDGEKSQTPSSVQAVLGVLFNTRALAHEKIFHVEAKPTRIANLTRLIDKVLSEDSLTPTLAASIVGKFGFLCSTLFGKVGRCCTAALRHRQYSNTSFVGLTKPIKLSLQLMKEFLQLVPAREIKLEAQHPLLVYTDASDVPHRNPQHVVGAVIFDPIDSALEFSSWAVPEQIVTKWLERSNHMGQLELLAAPFALATWASRFQNRSVLMFIDNNSAASNLVKGYSPQSDSATIVGEFWLEAAQLRTSLYIDRVESKSNIADGPSRLDYKLVQFLGGSWQQPDTGKLGSPDVRPAFWFGTPNQRGEDSSCHQQRGE